MASLAPPVAPPIDDRLVPLSTNNLFASEAKRMVPSLRVRLFKVDKEALGVVMRDVSDAVPPSISLFVIVCEVVVPTAVKFASGNVTVRVVPVVIPATLNVNFFVASELSVINVVDASSDLFWNVSVLERPARVIEVSGNVNVRVVLVVI